jgi:hypothetical protein
MCELVAFIGLDRWHCPIHAIAPLIFGIGALFA